MDKFDFMYRGKRWTMVVVSHCWENPFVGLDDKHIAEVMFLPGWFFSEVECHKMMCRNCETKFCFKCLGNLVFFCCEVSWSYWSKVNMLTRCNVADTFAEWMTLLSHGVDMYNNHTNMYMHIVSTHRYVIDCTHECFWQLPGWRKTKCPRIWRFSITWILQRLAHRKERFWGYSIGGMVCNFLTFTLATILGLLKFPTQNIPKLTFFFWWALFTCAESSPPCFTLWNMVLNHQIRGELCIESVMK